MLKYSISASISMSTSIVSLLTGLSYKANNKMFALEWHLTEITSLDSGFELTMDYISLMYAGLVLSISASISWYSKGYMQSDPHPHRFLLILISFISSSSLMVFSAGLFSISLGWDSLGLTSYCLVIYYQNWASNRAGMITLMTNRIGDVSIITAICLIIPNSSWSFMEMNQYTGTMTVPLLISIAAMTKSAQVPFSAWLPEAMAAPTPVSALVHSSTLVTAGVFLLIRLEPMINNQMQYLILTTGLLTSLLAGMNALTETDMKKVVAMSTLSQLGLMMTTIALGAWMIAYLHMSSHALFKASMFLAVGNLIHSAQGSQDSRKNPHPVYASPITSLTSLISTLCLMGLPFSCAFYSKDPLMELAWMTPSGPMIGLLYMIGLVLSSLYGLRLFIMTLIMSPPYPPMTSTMPYSPTETSMASMSLPTIIGGAMVSWMIDINPVITLTTSNKLFGLGVIVLTSGMSLNVFDPIFELNPITPYKPMSSLSYLSPLSLLTTSTLSTLPATSKKSEMWVEEPLGKGASLSTLMTSQTLISYSLMLLPLTSTAMLLIILSMS